MKFGIKSTKLFKKGFDSQPIYNEIFLNTRIKSSEAKVNTNFIMIKCQKKALILFVY